MLRTISNNPSVHLNDFTLLMDPFSFNFNKNNVPPPIEPKHWLVAMEEKVTFSED